MSDGTPYTWGPLLPRLAGERVTLRPLADDDVPDLYAVFSDAEVMRYWSSPPMQSSGEAAGLLRAIRAGYEARHLFQWGIVLRPADRVVGTCTLLNLDRGNRRAEVGFALARERWGRGLAAEALRVLVAFAFAELGLHRLEADVDPRNDRSLRLLAKQGFRREGYLRQRYHVGGEVQDAVLLGLLAHEWTRVGRPGDGGDGVESAS